MSATESTYQTCLSDLTSTNTSSTSPTTEALLQCISNSFDAAHTNTNASIDAFFLLYASTLIFFMQTGFAMVCAGCVRLKNVQNTLLKNVLDACAVSLGFYSLGYAFAFGTNNNNNNNTDKTTTFIGNGNYFLIGVVDDSFWLFQFAFCATSGTIVAGALAERCQMTAYLAYSLFLSSFVYPVVVHAIWSDYGFLSPRNINPLWGSGMIDFAGSCVVHVTGGATALIASKVLGPRTGRFYDAHGNLLENPKEMPGHSLALQCLGTLILWFGWYGFNCGSVITLTIDDHYKVISHTAINLTLSGATGCIMTLIASTIAAERSTGETSYYLPYALNGCLSGLVAITAGCSIVEHWASIVIGLTSGALYLVFSKLLVKWKIDDAVDAIPVHLINGIWGTICVGLFAAPDLMSNVYNSSTHAGWFYSWGMGSADARLLACQLVGILFVIAWVLCMMLPFFWLLHYFGYLRADALEEYIGLDVAYRGGIFEAKDNEEDEATKKKMDEYIKEYEHRRAEKASFIQMHANRGLFSRSPIQGSSLHNDSLHGNSYHGRKVITQNSLVASKNSQASLEDSQRSRARDEMGEDNAIVKSVDVENWAENIRE